MRMEASLDRQAARAYHRLRQLQQDRPPAPTQDPQVEQAFLPVVSDPPTENPQNEPDDCRAGFSLREASASPSENPQNEPDTARPTDSPACEPGSDPPL